MKKKNLTPLQLDKETIAKLDEKQIDAIVGGKKGHDDAEETNCDISCNGNKSCKVTCNNNIEEAE